MNEQKPKSKSSIEWTRVYGRRGYTWNPVGGCHHACRWTMPDGTTAECYAETVANKFRSDKFMPHGFDHHYFNPERLKEPTALHTPAGIFLDSMSDLMGAWVPSEQIEEVLTVCRETPQHIYFLLTKNAPRLLQFKFPANVWVGASSPPDFMFGKPLARKQQTAMLTRILDILERVDVPVRWISFEPLSWDVSALVSSYSGAIQWAVIGAASSGRKYFPPDVDHFRSLLTALDSQSVAVFYKGNLKSLPLAASRWREDFPGDSSISKQPIKASVLDSLATERISQPTLF